MNVTPLPIARVSSQLRNSLLTSTLQGSQLSLLQVQTQMATLQRLNRASDDPAAALGMQYLRRQLTANKQFVADLQHAEGFLNTADAALGSLTDVLTSAKSIASAQVGLGSTPAEREAQAAVVDSLLSQTLALANRQYRGASLFGGINGTQDPFVAAAGGYLYQGSTTQQGILTPGGDTIEYTIDGNALFGGLSAQVVGYRQITPNVTANTRLADLRGATGTGVTLGTVTLTDGTNTAVVDLSGAATAGDVLTLVNDALAANSISATMAASGTGFSFTTGATTTLNISGTTGDLGLPATVAAGSTSTPVSVSPRITRNTMLSSLGVDWTGIQISNGSTTATVSLIGSVTVEDLLNKINGSGTHVRAEINAAADGFNIFNALSGTQLRIGEAGGTTADNLGVRSFHRDTDLAEFNLGTGITPVSTINPSLTGDIQITRRDGAVITVDFTGVRTVQDVLDRINTAAGNTTLGSQVVASLNLTGNGIRLFDQTAGTGTLEVAALNGSPVRTQLGLDAAPASATELNGRDVNGLQPRGIFSALMLLRDSLRANDTQGIGRAAALLETDAARVVQTRGVIGARVKDVVARQDQAEGDELNLKESLSLLADTDMTEAITRYQALQTAYEASLRTAQTSQSLSLLDFLR